MNIQPIQPIQPSPCKLSDALNALLELKEEVDNTLLDKEKLELVNEAAGYYNHITEMASSDYFTEMEDACMRHIAKEFKEILQPEIDDIKKNYDKEDIIKMMDSDIQKYIDDIKKNYDKEDIIKMMTNDIQKYIDDMFDERK